MRNSMMPIEVRRVRVLTVAGGGSGLGSPAGGGTPFGGMGGMGGAGPAGFGPAAQPQESSQFDIPVEIHAIIYIFNPPDREKFGKGAAAAAAPPGGPPPAMPAAPPAGRPAMPPAGLPGVRPAGLPAAPPKNPGR